MFNRRFLRIKVFQALYAYYQDEQANRHLHEKNLTKSLAKTYELYIFLLAMPAAFRHFVSLELETQKAKYIPVPSQITPLEALINNKAIILLEENNHLVEQIKLHKAHWSNNKDLFKHLFALLKKNEVFIKYAEKSEHTFFEDKSVILEMFELFVADSEDFNNYVEDRFMNWEDDQTMVYSQLLKTISALKENATGNLLATEDTNEEDETFLKELFKRTVNYQDELTGYISAKTKNWDADRLAVVDLMLMRMALCEMLHFPYIPVKVSINEYLELAKLYSTPNSHGFINGVLDKVNQEMKQDNKLNKLGRGLVE
ncbi:MAG: transcription antitermination factor NusB [Bacteroidia bacterium]|nr:transcription antitermination factor NusB [Bacteroidia bacterium]MBP9688011.1 transcription antitermination factor NusB [Bacteroidia bacterium]